MCSFAVVTSMEALRAFLLISLFRFRCKEALDFWFERRFRAWHKRKGSYFIWDDASDWLSITEIGLDLNFIVF